MPAIDYYVSMAGILISCYNWLICRISVKIGFTPPTKHSTAITININPINRIITLFPVSPMLRTKRVERRNII